MAQKISQKELKELFDYRNGELYWKVDRFSGNGRKHISAGDLAGGVDITTGYRRIGVNGVSYKAHRLIWLYHYGKMPIAQLDHINHDKLDNKLENLREVTQLENNHNRTQNDNNTSGFTGVNWSKQRGKWCARIRITGKRKHLGYFINLNDAILARKSANIEYGYHINHGATHG